MKALFRAVNNEHSNSIVAEQLCYRKGDFVVVMSDGHTWGKKECPPNFVSVFCPDVSVEQARQYLARWDVKAVFEVIASLIDLDRSR